MPEILEQLTLPSEHSEETLWVMHLKERLVDQPVCRGDRLSYNMKIKREVHAKLMKYAAVHGITVADLLMDYIDKVLPVIMKAKPVNVPGYKKDLRTNPLGRGR